MKKRLIYLLAGVVICLGGTGCSPDKGKDSRLMPLKEALKDKFLIGVAMNADQITGADTAGVALIRREFNSIVAENCMKSAEIHPEKDRYDFALADRFVEFGERNDMTVTGHTLIWHSQLSPWFAVDEQGNDVSREELIGRMRDHITTIVTRYKGRVKGWDVVNEAFEDDGSYRQTPFYRIIGEEYLELAFRFARQADPDAELYYNDYSMFLPGRRDAVVSLIRKLKEKELRIDAIGIQGHMGLEYPNFDAFERSMQAFIAEGVSLMVTEFDMSVLPTRIRGAEISLGEAYSSELDPHRDGLSQEVEQEWENRMKRAFGLFFKYSDHLKRVTLWGLTDGDSWKNDWPIVGRTDYPLLFDRNHEPKPIVEWIVNHQ